VFRGLHLLAASAPRIQTGLETGSSLRLIEAVRDERLDAAVVALPAPVRGLEVTSLGAQRAVAAIPVIHANAVDASLSLERLAPERIVVLPHETNPAFHNAVVSICRDAGLAPTIIETAEPRVEHALLAVASGAGLALLPESVVDRFATPGIRFVPLDHAGPVFEAAVVTRPGIQSLATVAFLRAVSRTHRRSVAAASRSAVPLAA
jgi:DNA-binding transcriptional LysR family regulator